MSSPKAHGSSFPAKHMAVSGLRLTMTYASGFPTSSATAFESAATRSDAATRSTGTFVVTLSVGMALFVLFFFRRMRLGFVDRRGPHLSDRDQPQEGRWSIPYPFPSIGRERFGSVRPTEAWGIGKGGSEPEGW
eukprot:scaffold282_cov345-Pavlova_lutheri.AAC.44